MDTHLKINEKSYSKTHIGFMGEDGFTVSVVKFFDGTNRLMRQEKCSSVQDALECANRISPKGSENMVLDSEVQTLALRAFLWDMYLYLKGQGFRYDNTYDIKPYYSWQH